MNYVEYRRWYIQIDENDPQLFEKLMYGNHLSFVFGVFKGLDFEIQVPTFEELINKNVELGE